eukprot:scaffold1245_cov252-Pinguiococcus_pyrenoidosus.AAC.23
MGAVAHAADIPEPYDVAALLVQEPLIRDGQALDLLFALNWGLSSASIQGPFRVPPAARCGRHTRCKQGGKRRRCHPDWNTGARNVDVHHSCAMPQLLSKSQNPPQLAKDQSPRECQADPGRLRSAPELARAQKAALRDRRSHGTGTFLCAAVASGAPQTGLLEALALPGKLRGPTEVWCRRLSRLAAAATAGCGRDTASGAGPTASRELSCGS